MGGYPSGQCSSNNNGWLAGWLAGDAVHLGGIIITALHEPFAAPTGFMPVDNNDGDDNNNGIMRGSGNWMVSGT